MMTIKMALQSGPAVDDVGEAIEATAVGRVVGRRARVRGVGDHVSRSKL